MSLVEESVFIAPDALAIARTLRRAPGFAFLWDRTGGPSYIAAEPALTVHTLDPEPELALAARDPLAGVPRWVGLLPYEARRAEERGGVMKDARPIPHHVEPRWNRYGAVVRVAEDVRVIGDDPAGVRNLARRIRALGAVEPIAVRGHPCESAAAHRSRIERALELIREGDIYQVNLARRFDFDVEGESVDLLEKLCGNALIPFGFAFDAPDARVVSSSPELCLLVAPNGEVSTDPIKGTRPRGEDSDEDERLVAELDADEKERAELAMVIDVERNDLGRVCRPGSVRLEAPPRVVTFGTVHHRLARVSGLLREEITRSALLEAALPSGSVTGAPKLRAMEVIAELERERRGLYTGAMGFVAHDGSMRLSMAIRTLTVRGREGHYFAGGGIVHGSQPDLEVQETNWKAAQIFRLLS